MEFLEKLILGISDGGIYAMIALGYTMVYGIAKMLNFAHGDVIMVGGYSILIFFNTTGLGFAYEATGIRGTIFASLIALVVSVIVCTLLGIVIEKLAYKPLRGSSPLAVLITAIGVSMLLQSIAQLYRKGSNAVPIYQFKPTGIFDITMATVFTLGMSIVVMFSLTMFVKRSKTGRAMIAVSEDKGAAQLMGINVNNIIMITFAIGSALAALAGFCSLATGSSFVQPGYGSMPGIKAFTAAVIGGIGSIPGAMLGGILLGIIENLCMLNDTLANYKDAIEFSILIIVLLIKPAGLLGKKRREKV
ncbi:MAG: branched-chain amino acid ABC transporter permease [Ruminococcaceae bacterium]|nr:branched-chain amino acid ABC transporter permease [Oscillospiraceae bacterium]